MRTPREVSPEELASMTAAYLRGVPPTALGTKHHMCPRRVCRLLVGAGVRLRTKAEWASKLTAEEEEAVCLEYSAGGRARDIAARLGLHIKTVRNIVMRRGGRIRTVRLPEEISRTRTHRLREDYFSHIDTPEAARILGFIAADGCITANGPGKVLRLRLARRDAGHLECIRIALGYSGEVRSGTSLGNDGRIRYYSDLTVCSTHLCDDLIRHGCGPRKSFTLEPWFGPNSLLRHYYGGLLDGDGEVFPSTGSRWRFGLCGTRSVVQGWLDFVSGHLSHERKVRPHGSIFKAIFHRLSHVQQLARLFYCDLDGATPLSRKAENARVVLSHSHKRRDHSGLDLDGLCSLHSRLGSWRVVAEELTMHPRTLERIVRRLRAD